MPRAVDEHRFIDAHRQTLTRGFLRFGGSVSDDGHLFGFSGFLKEDRFFDTEFIVGIDDFLDSGAGDLRGIVEVDPRFGGEGLFDQGNDFHNCFPLKIHGAVFEAAPIVNHL